jgi:hypothetical protein
VSGTKKLVDNSRLYIARAVTVADAHEKDELDTRPWHHRLMAEQDYLINTKAEEELKTVMRPLHRAGAASKDAAPPALERRISSRQPGR